MFCSYFVLQRWKVISALTFSHACVKQLKRREKEGGFAGWLKARPIFYRKHFFLATNF
jgi:hypothetical protein